MFPLIVLVFAIACALASILAVVSMTMQGKLHLWQGVACTLLMAGAIALAIQTIQTRNLGIFMQDAPFVAILYVLIYMRPRPLQKH